MSTKTPDVLRSPPSPLSALTLAEMHVLRWEVRAQCNRCKTDLRVSLPAMIKTHGPDAVWWGQKPACPGFECRGGILTYTARSIRGGSWVCISAHTPSERDLQTWKNKQVNYRGPR